MTDQQTLAPIEFTARERQLLTALAKGQWCRTLVSEEQWRRPGFPSPEEIILSKLVDRGLVDWSGSVDEAAITIFGREALEIEPCRCCGHARRDHRKHRGICFAPPKPGAARESRGRGPMCFCMRWRATSPRASR